MGLRSTSGNQQGSDRRHPAQGIPDQDAEAGKRSHLPEDPQHTVSKILAPRGGAAKGETPAAPFATHSPEPDQEMANCPASPPHLQSRACQGSGLTQPHEATPRIRLNFEFPAPINTPTDGKSASINPFAKDGREVCRSNILQKPLKDISGGWAFQRKKTNLSG